MTDQPKHQRAFADRDPLAFRRLVEIAPGLVDCITRHVMDGRASFGHWMTAVFENNLMGGVCYADSENIKILPDLLRWIHSYIPAACHGSAKKLRAWKGLSNA